MTKRNATPSAANGGSTSSAPAEEFRPVPLPLYSSHDMDWEQMRARLSSEEGPGYWRSLQELSGDPEVRTSLEREFPVGAADGPAHPSRRRFLQLMGASLALAGLSGCRQPEEKIVPYVEMPENIVPGKPLFFATAARCGRWGLGLVAENHMGRPTKVEGNHLHPASLGATGSIAQASILDLYDPDRSQAEVQRGVIRSRTAFLRSLERQVDSLRAHSGRGLRVLTETVLSPTLAAQLEQLQEQFPEMRWHQYEPVMGDEELRAARIVFGQAVQTRYDFGRAQTVVSLGADFLNPNDWPPAYSKQFMQRRRVTEGSDDRVMSRLYAVESTPTITWSKADHHWSVEPADIVRLTRAIASRLGIDVGGRDATLPAHIQAEWVDELVADLKRPAEGAGEASLVLAGREQPAEVQALAHAINDSLGNVGKTVTYLEPVEASPELMVESLQELTAEMRQGEVEVLLILGGNPVFTAPSNLAFAAALANVPYSVHHGLYLNETAVRCDWHLPALHYLEAWSDLRTFDGTASLVQPLIDPLYDGWSEHQLLGALAGESETSAYDRVRQYWRDRLGAEGFEEAWEKALREGILPGTEATALEVSIDLSGVADGAVKDLADGETLTGLLRPDPSIYDGTYANNGWLQELPKPHTKLTWDNAALISPVAAERLGLQNGDLVRVETDTTAEAKSDVVLPIHILPGQSERTVTFHFGYGREEVGRVGSGAGFNVYPLRTSSHLWQVPNVRLVPTGKTYDLATTQTHFLMEGRHPVEHGTYDELRHDPEHPPFMHPPHVPENVSLYPEWDYDGYKWGMAVDLTSCTGCNACVVACQSENNIPIVGKEQVEKGREMHWMRIDTYFSEDVDNPETYHQPVMCMHCEKAPCEVVCPVAATTHSEEGLNEMTYNRCVGTRYCSNNCPYKVRRFNFLDYHLEDEENPVLHLQRNPDVTVRSRGVMEKCTYCVQRINHARIDALTDDRSILPGDFQTACQAACPADAIRFGNMNREDDPVNAWKGSPLNYGLLADLDTQPRTTYLASLANPNPRIHDRPHKAAAAGHGNGH